jgi:hypothetical protein
MYLKYEFCDSMPYEEKYWCHAPDQPGVMQTRDAATLQITFISYTRGGSLRLSLGQKDPNKNFGNLSGYEKNLVKGGGKLEVRYAVTDSVGKALDLRNFLLHKHVAKHGYRPLGQKQTPTQCPVGRSGGCPACQKGS